MPQPPHDTRAAGRALVPPWIWLAAAALAIYPLVLFRQGGPDGFGRATEIAADTIRLLIESAAFFWAARRHDLPARLRLALRVTAWTSVSVAVNYVLLLPPLWGGPVIVPEPLNAFLALASYLGGAAALVIYPRAAARRGEPWSLAIDLLITAGGLSALSWVLVTLPTVATVTDPVERQWVVYFGLAQLATLAAINLVVVRGAVVPSRRAFWWFVTGQACYLPVVMLTQLESARVIDPQWSTLAYCWGVLPTLAAAVYMRGDPLPVGPQWRGPIWLRDFNPLPLLAPIAVGAGLLLLLRQRAYGGVLMLAVTLVAVSLLLAMRLLLSAHHAARLAHEDAAKERRRHADRLHAVGRLAGGVAHEFNNLMARVVGHADLGEAALPADAPSHEHFVRIRVAAMRAGELTRQLLAFSGQQRGQRRAVDLAATVREIYDETLRALPPQIAPRLHVAAGPLVAPADEMQVRAAVEQLLENALEAMPEGGRLTVSVSREHLREPLATPFLPAPPGHYVAIVVRDTGVGIAAASLPVVCDPFYSTKAAHLGAGLGLASVHGTVAGHDGGLRIESESGAGTTVAIYLPVA